MKDYAEWDAKIRIVIDTTLPTKDRLEALHWIDSVIDGRPKTQTPPEDLEKVANELRSELIADGLLG